jgi:hypothetical protein
MVTATAMVAATMVTTAMVATTVVTTAMVATTVVATTVVATAVVATAAVAAATVISTMIAAVAAGDDLRDLLLRHARHSIRECGGADQHRSREQESHWAFHLDLLSGSPSIRYGASICLDC